MITMVSILLILLILWSVESFYLRPTTSSLYRQNNRPIVKIPSEFTSSPAGRKFVRIQTSNDDDDDDKTDIESGMEDEVVTVWQRARILSYRAALLASALLISVRALGDGSFLDGTGVNVDDWAEPSRLALSFASGSSVALAPTPKKNDVIGTAFLGLGALTLVIGVGAYRWLPLAGPAWTLSMLALMAVSIREILYFGGAYKQECGITLFMLPLMLDLNNPIPFTSSLCALGMAVLAAGKLFEPCREDLIPDNDSKFLAK